MRTSGFWVINSDGGGLPRDTVYPFRAMLDQPLRYVVEVADNSGRLIGELQPWGSLESVVWRVDSHGTVRMDVAPSIVDNHAYLIEAGNRVRIRFDNDTLPPWAGVIDPPNTSTPGAIVLTFYSAEYMLTWWETPTTGAFTGVNAATILRRVLDLSPGNNATISTYESYDSQAGAFLNMSYTLQTVRQLADHLGSLDETFHWLVVPDPFNSDGILFMLETFSGYRDDRDTTLALGINLAEPEVMTQGPILNTVVTATGSFDSSEPVTLFRAVDEKSEARHAHRFHFQILSDRSMTQERLTGEVQRLGLAILAEHKQPRLAVRATTLNVPPSRFGSYRVGDLARVELNGLNGVYDAQALITAMEFRPSAGTVSLVMDIQQETG